MISFNNFSPLTQLLNQYKTVLFGATAATTNYATFRESNGVSGFQVPEFFNLKIKFFDFYTFDDLTPFVLRIPAFLGYGDDDVGLPGASPPTNPKYFIDDPTNTNFFIGNKRKNQYYIDFTVPALKYPFIYDGGKISRLNAMLYANLEPII